MKYEELTEEEIVEIIAIEAEEAKYVEMLIKEGVIKEKEKWRT